MTNCGIQPCGGRVPERNRGFTFHGAARVIRLRNVGKTVVAVCVTRPASSGHCVTVTESLLGRCGRSGVIHAAATVLASS